MTSLSHKILPSLLLGVTILFAGCQPETNVDEEVDMSAGVEVESDSVPADATEEQIVQIEADCEAKKKGHIIHCGMTHPEKDFECRTTEADTMYRECVAATILQDLLGEESSGMEMEASMNHN